MNVTGREYTDAETGFVYLRARYFDPATGQFISRDPLVALTGSAYGYVDGNPLNFTDPLGLIKWGNVFSSRNLKIAALGLGLAALAVATAGTAPALLAVVSVQTIGSVSTGLALASTVASAGVAYQDCSRVRDANCYASLAELAGGGVSTGVGGVAGRFSRPLISIASGGLGVVFDLLAFATPRGEATAWISHGPGGAVRC